MTFAIPVLVAALTLLARSAWRVAREPPESRVQVEHPVRSAALALILGTMVVVVWRLNGPFAGSCALLLLGLSATVRRHHRHSA